MEMTSNVKWTTAGHLSIGRDGRSGKDYTMLGKKGQFLTGIITGVSQKISIDFGGTEVTVPKNAVRDAREGEERVFEIKDVSKNSIVLKEVEKSVASTGGTKAIMRTMVGSDKVNFTSLLEESGMSDGNTIENASEKVDSLQARMTGEDVRTMEEEGISAGKSSVERVEKMLTRIKRQRMERENGIEGFAEKEKKQGEMIEQIAASQVAQGVSNGAMAERIAATLEQQNLPVTEENVQNVLHAMEQAEVAPQMSEQAMGYMIDQGLEPTIGNVYQAQYTGSGQMADAGQIYGTPYVSGAVTYDGHQPVEDVKSEEAWQELLPQVEKIVAEAGMEANPDVMEQAKWLFLHELPVTAGALQQYQQLQNVKEAYDPQEIMERVVERLALGEDLEGTSLVPAEFTEEQKSIDVFLAEVDTQLQEITVQTGTDPSEKQKDLQLIAKRRQLEEVRLKMTADVAGRLADKGINLDVDQIEQVVKGLKELEEEAYKNLLQESGAAGEAEEIALLRETENAVAALREVPDYILGMTLERRSEITFGELRTEGEALKKRLEQAGEAYETLMTRPDRELGDSIQKAFQNVPDILEDLGMDATEGNVRAVKILAYNHIAINEENIYRVKEYDAQVNHLIKEMHPAAVVEMIKRNINPLEQTIEELDQTVQDIKEDIGVTEDEKYSKFLYQLEQRQGISPEDRTTFINIYKLLNNIQKMSGAAVGYVMQTDREMNLENLMTAVRTLRNGGVEEQVGESAEPQEIKYSRSMLLSQVQEAFTKEKEPKERFYEQVVDQLAEELSPSGLERLQTAMTGEGQAFTELYQQDLERVLEQYQAAKQQVEEDREEADYEEEMLKNFRQVADNSDRMIAYLNGNNLPVTMENLVAAGQMQEFYGDLLEQSKKTPKEQQERLKECVEALQEGMDSAEEMQESYEALGTQVEQIMEERFGDSQITSMELEKLRILSNQAGLLRQLASRQDYEIPVLEGSQLTQLHVTILNGSKDAGKAKIQMEHTVYGKIAAEFTLQEGAVQGVVLTESKKAAEDLQKEQEDFEERITAQGMELGRMTYGIQKKGMDAYANTDDTVQQDTRNLYQIAKAFVQHVSHMEQTEQ